MHLFDSFRLILLLAALTGPLTAGAISSHTYVLSYEGTIDGDAKTIVTEITGLFKDLDHAKVNSEIFHQNYPNTNIYLIEAFFEPINDEAIDYVDKFAQNHVDYVIGSAKISARLATSLTEFLSINCFGLDQSGAKETKWGNIVRYRQFGSVSEYQTGVVLLGSALAQGSENDILTNLLPILGPVDARIFQEWINGSKTSKQKMSRFLWESRSFFLMEDGSLVGRPMTWHVNRELYPPSNP